ncbi:MAG: hypothetical protein AAFX94_03705 [Myxococcota bacterium]
MAELFLSDTHEVLRVALLGYVRDGTHRVEFPRDRLEPFSVPGREKQLRTLLRETSAAARPIPLLAPVMMMF